MVEVMILISSGLKPSGTPCPSCVLLRACYITHSLVQLDQGLEVFLSEPNMVTVDTEEIVEGE